MSQGEREQASRIVRDIWEGGIRSTSFEDPRTPEFAKAALSELVALLEKGVPGLLQEALEGADLSANQLAVDDTHGLLELVQNADDQRASRLRFGLRRKSSRRELLAAHDGDPITLSDIAAMCVAFVSTKRDDPGMTGKFGIGLKTLSRLADRFEVHCSLSMSSENVHSGRCIPVSLLHSGYSFLLPEWWTFGQGVLADGVSVDAQFDSHRPEG